MNYSIQKSWINFESIQKCKPTEESALDSRQHLSIYRWIVLWFPKSGLPVSNKLFCIPINVFCQISNFLHADISSFASLWKVWFALGRHSCQLLNLTNQTRESLVPTRLHTGSPITLLLLCNLSQIKNYESLQSEGPGCFRMDFQKRHFSFRKMADGLTCVCTVSIFSSLEGCLQNNLSNDEVWNSRHRQLWLQQLNSNAL